MEFTVHYCIKYEYGGGSYSYQNKYCKIKNANSPHEAIKIAINTKIDAALQKLRAQGLTGNPPWNVRLVYIRKVAFKLPSQCGVCGTPYEMKNAWIEWMPTTEESHRQGGPAKIDW